MHDIKANEYFMIIWEIYKEYGEMTFVNIYLSIGLIQLRRSFSMVLQIYNTLKH